jgi:RimJ/RimL family protein N-acetyltransferase
MAEACAPASITKYMSLAFAHPYTLSHAETWISINLKDNLPNYLICEKDAPEICVGGIGLKPGADVQSHTAEIGYWLAEPHWGKGYLTEALRGLTDWVFEEKSDVYRRLWANVFEGNDASMRVLERCGYLKEGLLKGHVEKHGVVMDLHVYGLTRTDWLKSRGNEGTG